MASPTDPAPEVPASLNKKHVEILKDVQDGWMLR